ncbi:MAG: hypothetical protein HY675_04810 [Chloroflexi bacterium]|nr:hypothetical protein [Chloroflexota bacterium]
MEEDILGGLKAFIGPEYVLCDRCGKPIRRRKAEVAQEGLGEDTLSAFEELCDECRVPEKDEETPPE